MRIGPAILDAYKAINEGWKVPMQEALRKTLPIVEDVMPRAIPEQDGVPPRPADKRSA